MTLRIGMIGTGSFSMLHAKLLLGEPDIIIAACSGTSMDKAERFASQFAGMTAYVDIAAMLDNERLDAVFINVPPFAHGDLERKLVARGIPFFIEKPVGITPQPLADIVQAIHDSKLITSVGYHFRYMDSMARAKLWLQDATVGVSLGYWMGDMPLVEWWRDSGKSGGQFVEQTTHAIDLLRYMVGEVEEVYAAFGSLSMHNKHANVTVPDIGTVTMKLAGGSVATISNTCLMPFTHLAGLHLYTDKGVLELHPDKLLVAQPNERTEYRNSTNHYQTEQHAFLHALRTGDTSAIRSTYEDAVRTLAVSSAAVRSANCGQPVSVASELQ